MNVSNEVIWCSEIRGKTARDIQSTSIMVQNRLKYINTFSGVYKRFHPNVFDPCQIYGRQAVIDQKSDFRLFCVRI